MKDSFVGALAPLPIEIKKDWPFFGALGAAAGLLAPAQFALKQLGIGPHDGLAEALVADGIPMAAYWFISVTLMALASINMIFLARGFRFPKFDALLSHLATRLTQLTSAMLCFSFGLMAVGIGHAAHSGALGGVQMSILIFQLDLLLILFLGTTLTLASNEAPFNTLRSGVVFLLLAVSAMAYVLIAGVR